MCVCVRSCLESALEFAILRKEVSLVVRGFARTDGRSTHARAHRQLGFSKATSANSCNDQLSPLGCTSRRDPPPIPSSRPLLNHPRAHHHLKDARMKPLTSFPFSCFTMTFCLLSIATNPATHKAPTLHPYALQTPESCRAYTAAAFSTTDSSRCKLCVLSAPRTAFWPYPLLPLLLPPAGPLQGDPPQLLRPSEWASPGSLSHTIREVLAGNQLCESGTN